MGAKMYKKSKIIFRSLSILFCWHSLVFLPSSSAILAPENKCFGTSKVLRQHHWGRPGPPTATESSQHECKSLGPARGRRQNHCNDPGHPRLRNVSRDVSGCPGSDPRNPGATHRAPAKSFSMIFGFFSLFSTWTS